HQPRPPESPADPGARRRAPALLPHRGSAAPAAADAGARGRAHLGHGAVALSDGLRVQKRSAEATREPRESCRRRPTRRSSLRMTARRLASRVTERVQKEGAFLAQALDRELSESGFELRDRALSTELSYGVIRTEAYLRERLRPFIGSKKTDERVMRELCLAVYQLDFLPRIPQSAAVNEAVNAVRRVQGRRGGGFVNAVVRRLAAAGPGLPLREAAFTSLPGWLRTRLEEAVGPDSARDLVDPGAGRGLTVRVVRGAELSEPLRAALEPVATCEGAFRFLGRGD